jgi:hypothetical protein
MALMNTFTPTGWSQLHSENFYPVGPFRSESMRRKSVLQYLYVACGYLGLEEDMNEVPIECLKPGTVLTVRCIQFPLVEHWGVVGYDYDFQG